MLVVQEDFDMLLRTNRGARRLRDAAAGKKRWMADISDARRFFEMLLWANQVEWPRLAVRGDYKMLLRANRGGWARLAVRGGFKTLLRARRGGWPSLEVREGFKMLRAWKVDVSGTKRLRCCCKRIKDNG